MFPHPLVEVLFF